MSSPMVSLIVPVFNTERFLEKCLDSLLDQTYDNYEIICVDDCSPDNSSAILAKYQQEHPDRIILLKNDSNMGLGLTRQHGIEESRGSYLMFIDSDDYVEKDYVQEYVKAAEATDADIVIGGYIRDAGDQRSVCFPPGPKWAPITFASAWAKLYRKALITDNDIAFSASRCSEDVFFTLCTFYARARCSIIEYAGYHYVLNNTSITADKNYDKNLEELTSGVFDEFLQQHDISKLTEDERRMIEYHYIACLLNTLMVFNRGCGTRRMKSKYAFFKQDLEAKFPDWRSNPYIGLSKPKGQTAKVRLAVGVCMTAHKLGLLKLLLYARSLQ